LDFRFPHTRPWSHATLKLSDDVPRPKRSARRLSPCPRRDVDRHWAPRDSKSRFGSKPRFSPFTPCPSQTWSRTQCRPPPVRRQTARRQADRCQARHETQKSRFGSEPRFSPLTPCPRRDDSTRRDATRRFDAMPIAAGCATLLTPCTSRMRCARAQPMCARSAFGFAPCAHTGGQELQCGACFGEA
jgi:hypothetical protein